MTSRDKAVAALMATFIVVGTFVIGITLQAIKNMRFAYDGPPTESASTPAVKLVTIARTDAGGWRTAGSMGATREQRKYRRTYHFKVNNPSATTKRYRIVDEFFDHRGKLVRRHVVGPVEAPPGTEATMDDELNLSRREARYIHRSTNRVEPLTD